MLRKKKCFTNNKILVHSNYHWTNWVDLINRPTKQEKKLQLRKTYILRKKSPKVWKYLHIFCVATFHKTFTYHDYNFTPSKKLVNLWFNFPKRAFGYQSPSKAPAFFYQAPSSIWNLSKHSFFRKSPLFMVFLWTNA